MFIWNIRISLLAAAAVLLAACGKEDRLEAVRLARVLTEKQSNFNSAGQIEKEFVANARAWCTAIAGYGSGRGEQVAQNASAATELAKSARAASDQLSLVRQALDAETLHKQDTRAVRNALTTQLTQRQRMLQDFRALLEDAATQFRQKSFAADAYPEGIVRLNALLESYKPPEDSVGSAISSLKAKYKLQESEI